jgi:nicastrin
MRGFGPSGFTNAFYHSHLDGRNNVDDAAVCAAATSVARALYLLATATPGDPVATAAAAGKIVADCGLVTSLLNCMIDDPSDASCKLPRMASSGVSKSQADQVWSMYPSVAPPYSRGSVPLVEGFVSNVLGSVVGLKGPKGFLTAHSPAVSYDKDKGWSMAKPSTKTGAMGIDDPMVWTESNWLASLGLKIYLVDSPETEVVTFLCGLAVLALSWFGVSKLSSAFPQHLKVD